MKILDVKIDNYRNAQLKGAIGDALNGTKKIKVSKINTEFLQRSLKDDNFRDILNNSDLNIVDGRGVLWAARYLTLPVSKNKIVRFVQSIYQMIYSGASIVLNPKFVNYPIPEAIPGIEAFNLFLKTASDCNSSVFLFGGYEKVLTSAVQKIKQDFPKLKISGTMNGYDFQKEGGIDPVAEINKTNAKMLIVALGSPRQERWINDNIGKLKNIKIAVGEGGTLDRIANPRIKSPKFINSIGLEWLWRTLFNKSKTETRNRLQKFWNAVPLFIYNVVKWKVKNGQTKA